MKLKSLLIVGASSLLLASCLKSKDSLGLIGDKGSIVTEIADVNTDGPIKILTLEGTPPTETFNLVTLKSYAARDNKPAGDKVHVKLALDNSALPSGMTALPTNAYTLPALEFDVPSGGQVSIPITLNKALLDLSLSYGIGLKITEVSAGVASELAKSIVVNLLVKNRFDGVYNITGTMVDLTTTAITGYYPQEADLETAGSLETDMFSHIVNNYGHPIISAGATSYYGGFTPHFIFDANNNVVAVRNGYGQGNNNRWGLIDPTGINKYDPATKTIRVKYFMTQGNATTVRTTFDETWTYLHSR